MPPDFLNLLDEGKTFERILKSLVHNGIICLQLSVGVFDGFKFRGELFQALTLPPGSWLLTPDSCLHAGPRSRRGCALTPVAPTGAASVTLM